jgi:hypothetical protein
MYKVQKLSSPDGSRERCRYIKVRLNSPIITTQIEISTEMQVCGFPSVNRSILLYYNFSYQNVESGPFKIRFNAYFNTLRKFVTVYDMNY